MGDAIYHEEEYKRFYENLLPLLNGPNIEHVDLKDLKKPSIQTGIRTKFGSYGWRSSVSSRLGGKSVYLGSKNVWLPNPTDVQKNIFDY